MTLSEMHMLSRRELFERIVIFAIALEHSLDPDATLEEIQHMTYVARQSIFDEEKAKIRDTSRRPPVRSPSFTLEDLA